MSEKTAGQKVLEHNSQWLEFEDDLIEYRKLMEPGLMKMVTDTAENSKDHPLYRGQDFYVVLMHVDARDLRQPINKCLARRSCPTPLFKQSVWKYRKGAGDLEFLWSIPSAILYYHILRNSKKYLEDKECAQLAQFVILMESGELLEWVKRENGEKIDAVIRIDKEPICQND